MKDHGTGFQCICSARNLVRQGYRIYLCQRCGTTLYTMFSAQAGFYTVPLATGLAVEREKQLEAATDGR